MKNAYYPTRKLARLAKLRLDEIESWQNIRNVYKTKRGFKLGSPYQRGGY